MPDEQVSWLPSIAGFRDGHLEHVCVWRVTLSGDAENGWELLADDERERYQRLQSKEDRRRAVVVRAALRTILAQQLHIPPREVELAYGPNGKPRLAGGRTRNLEFNSSHAGEFGLIAMTSGRPVGVDIERVRVVQSPEALARKILARREYETWEALPTESAKQKFLFACWTAKEAALKAAGCGVVVQPDSLVLNEEALGWQRISLPAAAGGDDWVLRRFSPHDGYLAAVALPADSARILQFFTAD